MTRFILSMDRWPTTGAGRMFRAHVVNGVIHSNMKIICLYILWGWWWWWMVVVCVCGGGGLLGSEPSYIAQVMGKHS